MLTEPDKLRVRARTLRSQAAAALDPAVEDRLLEQAEELDEKAAELEGKRAENG